MKIVRFSTPQLHFPDNHFFRIGLLEPDRVVDLTAKDPAVFGSMTGLLGLDDPAAVITEQAKGAPALPLKEVQIEPPIDAQEVWATDSSYPSGHRTGARPELYLKSTPERCVGHGQSVRMREDSRNSIPEPELVLVLNNAGIIVGYTLGNDLTARDILAENPLHRTQAKLYRGGCALGPCILLHDVSTDPRRMEIEMRIDRGNVRIFQAKASVGQIQRPMEELVDHLFRENDFGCGVFLMTGTGIVPPTNFTLDHGDEIEIEIPAIGLLKNVVE